MQYIINSGRKTYKQCYVVNNLVPFLSGHDHQRPPLLSSQISDALRKLNTSKLPPSRQGRGAKYSYKHYFPLPKLNWAIYNLSGR